MSAQYAVQHAGTAPRRKRPRSRPFETCMHREAQGAPAAMPLLARLNLARAHAFKTGRLQDQTGVCFTQVSLVSQPLAPSIQKEGDVLRLHAREAPRAHARAARRPTWAMDVSSCPYVICVPTRSTACAARAQGRQCHPRNPNTNPFTIRNPTRLRRACAGASAGAGAQGPLSASVLKSAPGAGFIRSLALASLRACQGGACRRRHFTSLPRTWCTAEQHSFSRCSM